MNSNDRNAHNSAAANRESGGQKSPRFSPQSSGLQPQLLVGGVVLLAVLFLVIFALHSFSDRVDERQAAYLEQCVTRSAIQCYVIEGRFPTTEEGVAYLVDNYGLQIDHKRYAVYYESIADNILPQIRVIAIPSNNHNDEINNALGDRYQQPEPESRTFDERLELEP